MFGEVPGLNDASPRAPRAGAVRLDHDLAPADMHPVGLVVGFEFPGYDCARRAKGKPPENTELPLGEPERDGEE